jgi:hypothetical protein
VNRALVIWLFVLLTGCTATMIQPPVHEYGPNEGPQIGKIVYGPALLGQDDAYKQMYSACNGHYKIINQDIQERNKSTIYDASAKTTAKNDKTITAKKTENSQDYTVITFECLKTG